MALVGAAVLAWLWFRDQTSVSLPDGAHLPMTGPLNEKPALRTPLDPNGFPALFNAALQVVEGPALMPDFAPGHSPVPPEPDDDYDLAARIFAMQAAVESDDGRAVYHFNMGNLTTAQGDYFLNPPSDTRHRYSVFLYPLQGAVAQVERVKRLWPKAYKAAYSGSVTAFAHELVPPGGLQYYEAPEKPYRDAMLARGKRFGWDSGVAGRGRPLAVVKRNC